MAPAPPMEAPSTKTRSGSAPGKLRSTHSSSASTRRWVYGGTCPSVGAAWGSRSE